MHSPNFLFPRFLKVSLGPILAIFHIANVFLVGYMTDSIQHYSYRQQLDKLYRNTGHIFGLGIIYCLL